MHYLKLVGDFQYDYTGLRPFVFTRTPVKDTRVGLDPIETDILACPFPFFSIEMDKGFVTSDADGLGFNIVVMACQELSPDNYRFIAQMGGKVEGYVFVATLDGVKVYLGSKVMNESEGPDVYLCFKAIVDAFLKRLQSEKLGAFNASGKSKFRNARGEKKTLRPINVVYVSGSSRASSPPKVLNRSVRWEHAIDVMCHWRKISPESYGLDRCGNRVVKGATFINSYTKGDGEVSVKVRKVTR